MARYFFGRERELRGFEDTLQAQRDPKTASALPLVFLISGQGGMGKTSLLGQYREIADRLSMQQTHLDWEAAKRTFSALQGRREDIAPFDVLNILHGHMEKDLKTKHFIEQIAAWSKAASKAKNELQSLEKERSNSEKEAIELTSKLLAEAVSNVSIGAAKKPTEFIVKKLGDLAMKRLQASLSSSDYRLISQTNNLLATALGQDFAACAERKKFVVFLDTYEIVDPLDFLFRVMIEAAGPNVIWVIAGRRNLAKTGEDAGSYFVGYDSYENEKWRITSFDLPALARKHINRLFQEETPETPPLTPEQLDIVVRATRGVPLAIDCAVRIWKETQHLDAIVTKENQPVEAVVREMIARYQLHCVAKEDKQALHAVALADGDRGLLDRLFGGDAETRMDHLAKQYAAVYRQAWQLHDEPKLFFRESLRNERLAPWVRDLNHAAIDYYRNQRQQTNDEFVSLMERTQDHDEQKTALRLLTHLLWLDSQQGWRWFYPRYVEALAYDSGFANALLEQLGQWQACFKSVETKRLKDLQAAAGETKNQESIEARTRLWKQCLSKDWLKDHDDHDQEREALAYWRMGKDLHRLNRLDEAYEAYQETWLRCKPPFQPIEIAFADDLVNLGVSYDRSESKNEAHQFNLYQRAKEYDSSHVWAWNNLGSIFSRANNLDEALSAYEKALELDSNLVQIWNGKGNVLKDLNRSDEALLAYENALELDKTFVHAWNGKGNALGILGRREEALSAYEKALELDQSYVYAWNGKGNTLFDIAMLDDALAAYEEALELDEGYSKAWFGKGRSLQKLNKLKTALLAYEKGLEIDANFAYAWHGKADVLHELGRNKEALSAYETALDLDQTRANSWLCKANTLIFLGGLVQALSSYEKALESDENLAGIWNNLGYLYRITGQLNLARPAFEKALSLDPDDVYPLVNLAGISFLNEDFNTSESLCQQALTLDQDSLYANLNLAAVWWRTEQIARSQALLMDMKHLFQKNPDSFLFACYQVLVAEEDADLDSLRQLRESMPGIVHRARNEPILLCRVTDHPDFLAFTAGEPPTLPNILSEFLS